MSANTDSQGMEDFVGVGASAGVAEGRMRDVTEMDQDRTERVVELGGKLAGLSLPHQVWVLALWPLLEQVLAFCVGLTDQLISGRMAEGAERVAILDAMGLAAYVAWFFNILQSAVATGVMALVSRATGGKDAALALRGTGQGVWLGLGAGLISMAALHFGTPLLIHGVGLSPAAGEQAERFLKVLAWSGPFSGVLFAINAALRGSGDTRSPFLSMVVLNVVNMVMSSAFVFAPGPLGGHGIAGIAAGTVCGWVAGCATSVVLMTWGRGAGLRWNRDSLKPHGETMQRILRVGAPQSFEILVMWLIHIFGIRMITTSGIEGALGAHMLAIRVESMSYLPGFAIAAAAAALAGQYLGAGSKEMAVKAVRLCWKVAVGMMTVIGIFFLLFRDQLIHLMAPKSDLHLHLASPLLWISALTQPFFATCITLKTSMRGAGATRVVMAGSFGSMVFYRVLVVGWLSTTPYLSLSHVWMVLGLDLVTQAVIFSWLHFRGRWLDARV